MVTLDYQNTSSEYPNQKTTPIDQQNELKMSEQEKQSQEGEQTQTQIPTTEVVNEQQIQQQPNETQISPPIAAITNSKKLPKSAVELNSVELEITPKSKDPQLAKKVLKLDLVVNHKDLDELAIKSPKSPLSSVRLPHQTSLSAQVDLVEDRKTLRDALYQGIFHRHRRTIFAVGSFLRMLRSRNSQYNTIRSSSEGEDIDESLNGKSKALSR